jgi:hypothetical protein
MSRVVRTDFQAVNSRNVVLFTFSDPAVGRAWVRANAALHDGLVLEEVSLVARRVYRPPAAAVRRNDFRVPVCGVAA